MMGFEAASLFEFNKNNNTQTSNNGSILANPLYQDLGFEKKNI